MPQPLQQCRVGMVGNAVPACIYFDLKRDGVLDMTFLQGLEESSSVPVLIQLGASYPLAVLQILLASTETLNV